MKRHIVVTATLVFSFLLIAALPVSASATVRMSSVSNSGNSAQIQQIINLADVINTLPDGHHDNFGGTQNQFFCRAEGWAADPDDRSLHLNIRIFSDDVEVAQTVADTFRSDLADAGVCTDGTCSFSVNLWSLISPDVDHLITVQAQDAQTGEWSDVYDTPKTLNCFEENFPVEGYHDAWEGIQNQFSCRADGWVIDHNDPNLDLNVRILSDGVEVAQTISDRYRQDLDEGGVCPGGTCSFSVDLWDLISQDTDHSITVQAQDAQTAEWANLNETPKTLNCTGPSWQQVNTSGFGDSQTNGVTSLEVFQSQLYAGTANWATGGAVWRWGQNGQWQQVSEAGFGNGSANAAIVDLATFQGKLYTGMGWNGAPGQVWHSANGTNWQPVTTDGFGDGDNVAITNFTVFRGMFYAGTGTTNSSAQIWRSNSGNSNSWTKVAPDGPGLTGNVTGFAVYKNVLYATVESASGVDPAQVWRSTNGNDWTTITTDGFGDANNTSTGAFAQFGGYLYLGTRNDATGGEIWRTIDGLHWELVVSDGFGDISNLKVESLLVHDDLLYAVTFNPQTGLQIWRSVEGNNWEQIISNGFGDSNNFSTLWGNVTSEYQGHIFIGTWNNVDGGELWMSTP